MVIVTEPQKFVIKLKQVGPFQFFFTNDGAPKSLLPTLSQYAAQLNKIFTFCQQQIESGSVRCHHDFVYIKGEMYSILGLRDTAATTSNESETRESSRQYNSLQSPLQQHAALPKWHST